MGFVVFFLKKKNAILELKKWQSLFRDSETLARKEQFLGFLDCSEWGDAGDIYHNIKQFSQESGTANLLVVAQCYDGAAVVAGPVSGVQQKMLQGHPTATYVCICVDTYTHTLCSS